VEFLFGDITPDDDQVIRAMIVLGGNDDQIVRSFGIAGTNTRVDRESKGRYAYGVLRNLMLEDTNLPIEEDGEPVPYEDYEVNGCDRYGSI
jgi:hypothetical protein